MNLYQNRFRFKVAIIVVAFLIGFVSLYYTNTLVSQLIQREKAQITLFSKALRYLWDRENEESMKFILEEIIKANTSVPTIATDENENIITERNLNTKGMSEEAKQLYLEKELARMKEEFPPIKINIGKDRYHLIYYRSSDLIYQLKYYPYIQLTVIAIFGLLAYLAFSYSRRAEQNRVWVGLAKETAHQLGTPISSLLAWVEYLKTNAMTEEILDEINKDVRRLEIIAARFSNIGSQTALLQEDIAKIIEEMLAYLRPRISTKIQLEYHNFLPYNFSVRLNRYLFEWVLENLIKNSVDAIQAEGKIVVETRLSSKDKLLYIDISDNGKGIPPRKIKRVFDPGYTTKKRGWGLGLTLAKRIIEEYHKGKIFVKYSELDKGTKFRIILKR
ncbi:sensor histidine kinase [Raineya orbicola]|jgi:signal transduction histidine kinase|uniref:histidine kinase n=1 Tax=Raineya orbicola TaxID=2016530 RepID=A0A2N3IG82_9BACT|nr:ATP-binding protein [Raineya orbicola]PKQ69268.1 Histidine kinase-, DNA gyrase B-, and HSP90-like ATPase [Raineya orbicola]